MVPSTAAHFCVQLFMSDSDLVVDPLWDAQPVKTGKSVGDRDVVRGSHVVDQPCRRRIQYRLYTTVLRIGRKTNQYGVSYSVAWVAPRRPPPPETEMWQEASSDEYASKHHDTVLFTCPHDQNQYK